MKHFTIRVRLTTFFALVYLSAGFVLLGATYLLVQETLDDRAARTGLGSRIAERLPTDPVPATIRFADGREVPVNALIDDLARRQEELAAEQERTRQETLDTLLKGGSAILGVLALLGVVSAYLISGHGLRPLNQITATARRVAERNLHERIPLEGRPQDEISDLARTFNSMLERLDRAFDGQRAFVANASHELRTPLAINRTLIDVALTREDVPEWIRTLGDNLLAVNARHERLIDGLLTLARSENRPTGVEALDLADVAAHVTTGRPVRLDLGPAPTKGDPVLIERVITNLVDNAFAYNVPDGWVSVRTSTGERSADVVVTNTGPVIPAYEIPALFEPFQRRNARTGNGAGLGLSIVAAVARAHRGVVKAEPRNGGGLVVTVQLPLNEKIHAGVWRIDFPAPPDTPPGGG